MSAMRSPMGLRSSWSFAGTTEGSATAGRRTSARWPISRSAVAIRQTPPRMTGVLTFLVADLDPAARPEWLGPVPAALQDAVDRAAAAHRGRRTAGRPGEGFVAIFDAVADAVEAAAAVRDSPAGKVRVALHTGEAQVRDDGRYTGAALR